MGQFISLYATDNVEHTLNLNQIIDIYPCYAGADCQDHTFIQTTTGYLIALKPYDEVKKLLKKGENNGTRFI